MADTNHKDKEKKPGNFPKLKTKGKFNFYWIYAIMFFIIFIVYWTGFSDSTKKTDWPQLREMLLDEDVEKIIIITNKDKAEIFIKEDKLYDNLKYEDVKPSGLSSDGPQYYLNIGDAKDFKDELAETQKNLSEPVYPEFDTRESWIDNVGWLLPILIIVVVWIVIMRMMGRGAGGGGGQIFNIGKSKAQLFDKGSSVTINFQDVAGLEEAKVEIKEIVDFLKSPDKYTKLGGKIPKGALLVGPPGTGKTLLAKAVAGEAKVPFFSISGSDFVEMFVGVGASRVRDLFKQAKEKAPCIIFIDEIDAIGRARGKNPMTGANDERENTLNQLLTEMDGFSSNTGVIILAATNRADILDRALMRAGRFDRQIHVELPDLEERKAIFKVHMRPLKTDGTIKVEFLAKQTPGFSGADIANVCNESALIAARNEHESVTKQDFMDAIDRIIGGLEKRNKIISPKEKKVIAFHEAGHASISWLLEHAHPLVKVTIVPRGKALGAAWYLPEERQITTWEQMFDEMTATLGGRASEEVIFGKVSTGALNDLEKVTKQAFNMVVYFGLNEKIGNISYYDSSGQQEYSFHKPYSEKTAELIDIEIKDMVEKAYKRAVDLLKNNRGKLEKLAGRLLEKEVIFSEDLEEIFGKRLWDEEKRIGENENNEDRATNNEDRATNNAASDKKPVASDKKPVTSDKKPVASNKKSEDNPEEPESK
ncbi:MAG: ATP-dependent zinc metalloprotease FtsH [Bacteroidales bacterium]|nr:ATP-dependent zinc metalloprotease FtsH [Bacteroidales bacterium]